MLINAGAGHQAELTDIRQLIMHAAPGRHHHLASALPDDVMMLAVEVVAVMQQQVVHIAQDVPDDGILRHRLDHVRPAALCGGNEADLAGLEKARVFLKKPSPVGFFGIVWVFFGFFGFLGFNLVFLIYLPRRESF